MDLSFAHQVEQQSRTERAEQPAAHLGAGVVLMVRRAIPRRGGGSVERPDEVAHPEMNRASSRLNTNMGTPVLTTF